MRNNRKGFTLIELLIVVVIVGILALAAIPLITSNTRDARRAEGEQLLGAARDFCRVKYSKSANTTTVGTNFSTESNNGTFTGEYFQIASFAANGANNGILKTNNGQGSDGVGTMDFVWASGQSAITWSP